MILPVCGMDPSLANWGMAEGRFNLATGFLDDGVLTVASTKKNKSKKTVFEKSLSFDFIVDDATADVADYEKVEFIGHDESYGDVFKAYHDADDDNNFTLFFGVKGSEFDEQ